MCGEGHPHLLGLTKLVTQNIPQSPCLPFVVSLRVASAFCLLVQLPVLQVSCKIRCKDGFHLLYCRLNLESNADSIV